MPAHRSPGPVVGQRYGRFVVVSDVVTSVRGKIHWLCRCDCGARTVLLNASRLRCGRTARCGCPQKRHLPLIHGDARTGRVTTEYLTWKAMKDRCLNPKAASWRYYGGRGIRVCERWLTFENFLADMGRKPSPAHSIDRIDNDRDYEPGNCRWATDGEQGKNRRCVQHQPSAS